MKEYGNNIMRKFILEKWISLGFDTQDFDEDLKKVKEKLKKRIANEHMLSNEYRRATKEKVAQEKWAREENKQALEEKVQESLLFSEAHRLREEFARLRGENEQLIAKRNHEKQLEEKHDKNMQQVKNLIKFEKQRCADAMRKLALLMAERRKNGSNDDDNQEDDNEEPKPRTHPPPVSFQRNARTSVSKERKTTTLEHELVRLNSETENLLNQKLLLEGILSNMRERNREVECISSKLQDVESWSKQLIKINKQICNRTTCLKKRLDEHRRGNSHQMRTSHDSLGRIVEVVSREEHSDDPHLHDDKDLLLLSPVYQLKHERLDQGHQVGHSGHAGQENHGGLLDCADDDLPNKALKSLLQSP